MKKTQHIVVCGNYGATNLGDEAILEGILAILRENLPQAEITVMSSNPTETAQLHKVESIYFVPGGLRSFFSGIFGGKLWQTLGVIKKCDLFVLGGGGLFTDEKLRAVIIWSLQTLPGIFYRKLLFCFGQSVGPLKTFLGRFMTKCIFSKARAISVRDELSLKVLEDLGIKKVEALADPVFALLAERNNALTREKYVVFSLRPWLKREQNNQMKVLAEFIDWLYKNQNLKSIFIPFQVLQDNDEKSFQEIQTHLEHKEALEFYKFNLDYGKALELIEKAEAVVGMRLHSLIFSTLVGTPFLALSYSDKVTAFAQEVGMEAYLLLWKNLQLEDLKNKFMELQKEQSSVEKLLLERRRFLKEKVKENRELLKTFIF